MGVGNYVDSKSYARGNREGVYSKKNNKNGEDSKLRNPTQPFSNILAGKPTNLYYHQLGPKLEKAV